MGSWISRRGLIYEAPRGVGRRLKARCWFAPPNERAVVAPEGIRPTCGGGPLNPLATACSCGVPEASASRVGVDPQPPVNRSD